MKIVATTSLPAVDRPNADQWNAARSRQNQIQNSQKMVYLILGHPVGNLFNMASPFQSHKCEEDVDRHTAMGKMLDQY